jgi:pimeloyl-ACP methyl ester carboxylesterase
MRHGLRLAGVAALVLGLAAACGVETSDGAGGAGGTSADEFPKPLVAGTPETQALADAAGRCGQPDFAWLGGDELGRIRAIEPKGSYTRDLLVSLLAGAKIALPESFALEYDVDTHLVTYATQDRGALVDATALVAWPSTVADDAEPLATLAILHGTTGFTDGCGATADSSLGLLSSALASLGFIVVVPDYIGLKATQPPTGFMHPYLVGQATALASLDAVRAVGQLPAEARTGGAKPSPRVVVLGGSQGGHAALWVDRLAPYYARELSLVGVAATVPPADMLGETTLALQAARSSTANVMAFWTAASGWYGRGGELATAFVPPFDTELPAALGASCDPSEALDGVTSLEAVFQPPLLAAAAKGALGDVDPWGCIIRENGLTTTSVARLQGDPASYGLLFVTGENDDLVDTPTERKAFEALCKAGTPMRYLECAGASHTKATAWALPEMLAFLRARLAGEAFEADCTAGAPARCAGTPD